MSYSDVRTAAQSRFLFVTLDGGRYEVPFPDVILADDDESVSYGMPLARCGIGALINALEHHTTLESFNQLIDRIGFVRDAAK